MRPVQRIEAPVETDRALAGPEETDGPHRLVDRRDGLTGPPYRASHGANGLTERLGPEHELETPPGEDVEARRVLGDHGCAAQREVINHTAPTSCIQVPMFDATAAIHSGRKTGWRSGAHADVAVLSSVDPGAFECTAACDPGDVAIV
jgi:hypothetical protein